MYVAPASILRGSLSVPGDKSISHRALMFAAIAQGTSRITNLAPGADVRSTADVLRSLGVSITWSDTEVEVVGSGRSGLRVPDGPLDCGNSGTTMRLMMGLLAGCGFEATLIGDESLSGRPMGRIAEPLRAMGLRIDLSRGGTAPVVVHGDHPAHLHWTSSVASAQVKSAILLAGLAASGTTSVSEPSKSRDHTERMLSAMGAEISVDENTASVLGGAVLHPKSQMVVPGDLSSAAFWLVAGLLRGDDLTIHGVGLNPTRTGVLDVLAAMGASVEIQSSDASGEPIGSLTVRRQDLRGTRLSGDLVVRAIDEIPILAVLATQAHGRTEIRDAQELRVKECDRISTVVAMLRSMGANVTELDDGMVIDGPTPLCSAIIDTQHDHRIAMSAAIAALCTQDGLPTRILGADIAEVSYPGFYLALDGLRV